jgi:hypothetical protein
MISIRREMAIRHISKNTFLRLSEEDKTPLELMAGYYVITQADMIRIALEEFARNNGFLVDKTRHELFAKEVPTT